MRKIIFLIFLVFTLGYSQNKQLLYDFHELPQTLLLNPGAEFSSKFHIGFPLLSKIDFQAGSSGFSAYDIFNDDGVNINTKIKKVIDNFGKSEVFTLNQQLEVLSAGYKLPNSSYLSFGYYQELDIVFRLPKDMVDLFYDGNSEINRRYELDKFGIRAEMLGVFHIGLTKKLNNNMQIGARAKIYSGVFNIRSKINSAVFYTEYGTNNIYNHHLENINAYMDSSGIIFDKNEEDVLKDIPKKILLGGNLGLGVDLGFTNWLNDQVTVTGSILDIGFVNNSKNVESYRSKGAYQLEGIQLLFDPNNPQDYWQNLEDDFEKNVVTDTIFKNYITLRPLKLNGSVSYKFGRPRLDECRFQKYPNIYSNKVGFHLYSTLGKINSQAAATLFFERRVNKNVQAKITYTVDSYSFKNIGLGISTKLGAFNSYLLVDNLLNFSNLYSARSASVQAGINFIFNDKN